MSTAPANAEVPAHDRIYGRLSQFTTAAMLPWLVVSIVSLMIFTSPNAIITPLFWAILIGIWSYPLQLVAGRSLAWVLRVYGQYDRANRLMTWPGSMGAFLFAMLIVPLLVVPLFTDGYFGIMASCMLSILVAHWTMARLKR